MIEATMKRPSKSDKPLILCVDDDDTILDLMRTALERTGYRVITANCGAAALETFAKCPVDCVTLDYDMPGMNGAELAQAMMRTKPNIPKLLLSGNPTLPCEEMWNFQGFCSKPCNLCTLVSHIGIMTSLARSA